MLEIHSVGINAWHKFDKFFCQNFVAFSKFYVLLATPLFPVTQKALELFLHLGYNDKAQMAIACQKLLLYGPSGCGKTLLASAIAGVSRRVNYL
jgi:ABC-type uncharacterized transport system fused permease/ATPase subunit